jgi:hypothetical protein
MFDLYVSSPLVALSHQVGILENPLDEVDGV